MKFRSEFKQNENNEIQTEIITIRKTKEKQKTKIAHFVQVNFFILSTFKTIFVMKTI